MQVSSPAHIFSDRLPYGILPITSKNLLIKAQIGITPDRLLDVEQSLELSETAASLK